METGTEDPEIAAGTAISGDAMIEMRRAKAGTRKKRRKRKRRRRRSPSCLNPPNP
jgi:hypothetical protein